MKFNLFLSFILRTLFKILFFQSSTANILTIQARPYVGRMWSRVCLKFYSHAYFWTFLNQKVFYSSLLVPNVLSFFHILFHFITLSRTNSVLFASANSNWLLRFYFTELRVIKERQTVDEICKVFLIIGTILQVNKFLLISVM